MRIRTNKSVYLVFFLILLFRAFFGCERDDICGETTPTTPHLIIRFYDITDTDSFKAVDNLTIRGEGLTEDLIVNSTTDSIALPLNFQEEGILTTSKFSFKKDSNFDSDNDSLSVSNTDSIVLTYIPEFIYISRACGYKSIFNNVNISVDADTDNWILNTQVINDKVDHENQAHIHIFY